VTSSARPRSAAEIRAMPGQPGVGPPPVLRNVRRRTGGEDYPGFVAGITPTPTGQKLVVPDEDDE
jgi:hypothetical protein